MREAGEFGGPRGSDPIARARRWSNDYGERQTADMDALRGFHRRHAAPSVTPVVDRRELVAVFMCRV